MSTRAYRLTGLGPATQTPRHRRTGTFLEGRPCAHPFEDFDDIGSPERTAWLEGGLEARDRYRLSNFSNDAMM